VAKPAAKPSAKVSAPVAASVAAATAAAKPQGLNTARKGQADDLKRIKGVGPKLEALLHKLGYFHFDQIATWTAAEVAWVDGNLEGFKGRVSRDGWVGQAKEFAREG
jgi:NADH-quinone oxidoreductase subunit E